MSSVRVCDLDAMIMASLDTATSTDDPSVAGLPAFDPTLSYADDEEMKVSTGKGTVKKILQDCNGVVNPGEVLAIMGASGAGKTSLLNLLAGRLAPSGNGTTSGSVLVNGQKRNFDTFRQLSAYVLQTDNFFAEMTVRETITLSALLRLPRSMSKEEKLLRVDSIILELGLRKCQDTIVGNELIRGVSGGERKRVNLGTELVVDPALVFLDEPTTGLDAFNAQNVMATLMQLARSNRTVVATIHQPRSNIFEMFDMLLLLSEGRVIYFGKASDSVAYFSRLNYICPSAYNPADYFLDLISLDQRSAKLETGSRARIVALASAYDKHLMQHPLVGQTSASLEADFRHSEKAPKYASTFGTQFSLLLRRSFNVVVREKTTNFAALGQTLIFALLLGVIWLDEARNANSAQAVAGGLFFLCVNQAFSGVFGIIFVFPAERIVVLKERASRAYHVGAYFWSKTIAEIPRTLLLSLIFSVISYFMIGLRNTFASFLLFFVIISLVVLNSEGLALCVSAMAKDPQAAGAIAPVFIVTSMLFGGFFIGVDLIPVWLSWLQYLSFLKYGFAAIMQNEFEDRLLRGGDCDDSVPFCPSTGEEVLEFYDVDGIPFWANLVISISMAVALRLLAYFILLRRGPKHDHSI